MSNKQLEGFTKTIDLTRGRSVSVFTPTDVNYARQIHFSRPVRVEDTEQEGYEGVEIYDGKFITKVAVSEDCLLALHQLLNEELV